MAALALFLPDKALDHFDITEAKNSSRESAPSSRSAIPAILLGRSEWLPVTQKEIDDACDIINDKPRKVLGYWSAREVAEKAKLFKNASVLIEG